MSRQHQISLLGTCYHLSVYQLHLMGMVGILCGRWTTTSGCDSYGFCCHGEKTPAKQWSCHHRCPFWLVCLKVQMGVIPFTRAIYFPKGQQWSCHVFKVNLLPRVIDFQGPLNLGRTHLGSPAPPKEKQGTGLGPVVVCLPGVATGSMKMSSYPCGVFCLMFTLKKTRTLVMMGGFHFGFPT